MEEFAGGGVDDADVEVIDDLQHGRSGVFDAHSDVMHAAVESKAELLAFAGAGMLVLGAAWLSRPSALGPKAEVR